MEGKDGCDEGEACQIVFHKWFSLLDGERSLPWEAFWRRTLIGGSLLSTLAGPTW
jgi:hypothetical protein